MFAYLFKLFFGFDIFFQISVFMPVNMVLTFQVSIFKFVCMSGALVNNPLVGEVSPLSSTHPEEQADRCGTVPSCVGSA